MLTASCIGLDFCIDKVVGPIHISVLSCASLFFFSDLLSDLSCISLFQLPRRFLIFYCLALNLPNLSPGFSSHSNISSNCSLYFPHRFMYTDWVQVFTQSLTFSSVFLWFSYRLAIFLTTKNFYVKNFLLVNFVIVNCHKFSYRNHNYI